MNSPIQCRPQFARLRGLLLCALLLMGLAACVTTEKGGLSANADEDRALELTLQLARDYMREGKWDAAKRHLKAAMEMDDSNAEVHEGMALVFQNTGELDRVDEHYRKAVSIDPSDSRIRFNYAGFLYSQEQYKEAIKQLDVVVKDTFYPQRASAYLSLGRCHLRLQNYAEAEAALKRGYPMNRGNPAFLLELADVNFLLGEYPKAQQYYDGFRKQVKKQSPRSLWLGIRLAEKFDNRDAFSSYSLALKNLYPTSQEYLDYKKAYVHDS